MQKIKFDTNLSPDQAAKTKLFSLLSEKGILAKCENILVPEPKFIFSEWKFSDIKNENEKVYFSGQSETISPLTDFFSNKANETNPDNCWEKSVVSYAVCSAYSQSLSEKIELPVNGAGGIYLNILEKSVCVLFLPQKLFDTVCSYSGAENYWEKQLRWISPYRAQNTYEKNILFTQSTIAYYALTQTMPYPNTNATMFSEEIRDKAIVLLEHKINGIDKDFAEQIDSSLLNESADTNFSTQKFWHELGLTENTNEIIVPERKNKIPEEEFMQKTEALYAGKKAKIATKRKLVKNKIIICAVAAVLLAVLMIALNVHKENKNKLTTLGLTSQETAILFYKSIHTLDMQLLTATSKGKAKNFFSQSISQLYVAGKMRAAYGGKDFVTPEEQLSNQQAKIETPVYGLVNFKIGGKEIQLASSQAPTNANHPPVLTEENGEKLSRGSQKNFTVEYTTILLDDVQSFSEEKFETVTLTFDGKKWLVTEVIEN